MRAVAAVLSLTACAAAPCPATLYLAAIPCALEDGATYGAPADAGCGVALNLTIAGGGGNSGTYIGYSVDGGNGALFSVTVLVGAGETISASIGVPGPASPSNDGSPTVGGPGGAASAIYSESSLLVVAGGGGGGGCEYGPGGAARPPGFRAEDGGGVDPGQGASIYGPGDSGTGGGSGFPPAGQGQGGNFLPGTGGAGAMTATCSRIALPGAESIALWAGNGGTGSDGCSGGGGGGGGFYGGSGGGLNSGGGGGASYIHSSVGLLSFASPMPGAPGSGGTPIGPGSQHSGWPGAGNAGFINITALAYSACLPTPTASATPTTSAAAPAAAATSPASSPWELAFFSLGGFTLGAAALGAALYARAACALGGAGKHSASPPPLLPAFSASDDGSAGYAPLPEPAPRPLALN